jgi:hypothetical protein
MKSGFHVTVHVTPPCRFATHNLQQLNAQIELIFGKNWLQGRKLFPFRDVPCPKFPSNISFRKCLSSEILVPGRCQTILSIRCFGRFAIPVFEILKSLQILLRSLRIDSATQIGSKVTQI